MQCLCCGKATKPAPRLLTSSSGGGGFGGSVDGSSTAGGYANGAGGGAGGYGGRSTAFVKALDVDLNSAALNGAAPMYATATHATDVRVAATPPASKPPGLVRGFSTGVVVDGAGGGGGGSLAAYGAPVSTPCKAASPSYYPSEYLAPSSALARDFSKPLAFAPSPAAGGAAGAGEPTGGGGGQHQMAAPVEAHAAEGQRSLQGPTSDGGWQCLTFLPQVEVLRYEARYNNSSKRKQLQIIAMTVSRWEALARTATLSAWQNSVSRLLSEAVREHRATELM